jgi:hypothetical protein
MEQKEGQDVVGFFYNWNNHLNDARTNKEQHYSSFILMQSLFYLMM